MVQPLVSIIVNNYNYAQFLRQAIDSGLNQTYPHTEVIVVDDGSTDDSPTLINSYGNRILPILKSNGGQASALNAGFCVSHGEIIIFLDADDYLFPHAVETVVAAWSPDVAQVQYRLELVDISGNLIDLYPPPEMGLDSGNVIPLLLKEGRYRTVVTSGNAFSRVALVSILPIPEPEFRLAADGYLVTLTPFYGKIASIELPLGAYRKHGHNLWIFSGKSLEVARFSRSIQHDFSRYKFLVHQAQILGYSVPLDLDLRDYNHLLNRLISLRLEPQNHPVLSDSRFFLVYHGFLAVWKSSECNWKQKLILSSWFLAIGVLPQPVIQFMIFWLIEPTSRPKAIDLIFKKIRLIFH